MRPENHSLRQLLFPSRTEQQKKNCARKIKKRKNIGRFGLLEVLFAMGNKTECRLLQSTRGKIDLPKKRSVLDFIEQRANDG